MIGEQEQKKDGFVGVSCKVPIWVAELLNIIATARGINVKQMRGVVPALHPVLCRHQSDARGHHRPASRLWAGNLGGDERRATLASLRSSNPDCAHCRKHGKSKRTPYECPSFHISPIPQSNLSIHANSIARARHRA